MRETLTETIRLRAPRRLTEALEREAQRRMLSRSDVVREALAEKLGLFEQDARQKAKASQGEV